MKESLGCELLTLWSVKQRPGEK